MADLEEILKAIHGSRVFDLGRELYAGMSQSPNHPPFRMVLQRRHGDIVREDGGSAASEMIVTGGHVGTHIDALSHVSHLGKLHGGIDAAEAQTGGSFSVLGVETVEPMVCRGVLLDVPSALGIPSCDPGYAITPEDLAAAGERASVSIRPGDAVLVRTGWGSLWESPEWYDGQKAGAPGVGEQAAEWLAEKRVRAAGADTIAFERIEPGKGHSHLPVHRILLVEHGIHIIETLALDEIAKAGVFEFLFILSPLKLVGATGSPVRPLAVAFGD